MTADHANASVGIDDGHCLGGRGDEQRLGELLGELPGSLPAASVPMEASHEFDAVPERAGEVPGRQFSKDATVHLDETACVLENNVFLESAIDEAVSVDFDLLISESLPSVLHGNRFLSVGDRSPTVADGEDAGNGSSPEDRA